VVKQVQRAAKALGVPWPTDAGYAAVIRALDGDVPADAALLALAARGLRGAGYLALVPGEGPSPKGPEVEHAAVAAPYAHVTAPLRRLADRYALEVCLAVLGGTDPAPELVAALDDLPKAMARASGREGNVARACIDLVEALLLRPRVGEALDATVVSVGEVRSTVVIPALAVQADVAGAVLPLGEPVRVEVEAADPDTRQVRLGVA
jgi:exoribonuclease R